MCSIAPLDFNYPYGAWACGTAKKTVDPINHFVMEYGESATGACFFAGISTLAATDGMHGTAAQNLTLGLWLATTATAFILPLAARCCPQSGFLKKIAGQDDIRAKSAVMYAGVGGTHCFLVWDIHPATAVSGSFTASGNAIIVVRTLFLTRERLLNFFKKVFKGNAERATKAVDHIEHGLNYTALGLRTASCVVLFGHDAGHTLTGGCIALGLISTHYRDYLKIRQAQKQPQPF